MGLFDTGFLRPFPETERTQVLRGLVRRLSAYIPISLVRRILIGGLPEPGKSQPLMAATLFSDISGFTAMAESLAGAHGVEILNRSLLMTFTAMINAIHSAGGVVAHFHGDAMLVYFPDDDGQAAQRALACARFMHSLMLTRAQLSLPNLPQSFELTIKIGVSYGRCLEVVVGDMGACLEFVLAGTAVDEAAEAQLQAKAGEVVAARAVLEQAGWPTAGDFRIVNELLPVPMVASQLHWEVYGTEPLRYLARAAALFVPPALVARLQQNDMVAVAEHRPITSIFVRFEGIDYEADGAGEQLQIYYEWARRVVTGFGGANSRVNRVLMGDKGSHLHIIFGAPVAPHTPEKAVRCALALQAQKPAFIRQQFVGVASGRAFACAVGSQGRREYTVIGQVVNLSARLMVLCAAGEVLVDETTAKEVKGQIPTRVMPAMTMKGWSTPVPVYLVSEVEVGQTQLQARFARQRPPLGRREELSTLLRKMDEALAKNGNVVAISGALGSGQEQLLAAGVLHWLNMGGEGHVGICQPHTKERPLAPWQMVWRSFFWVAFGHGCVGAGKGDYFS